jgi:hypothetical protein
MVIRQGALDISAIPDDDDRPYVTELEDWLNTHECSFEAERSFMVMGMHGGGTSLVSRLMHMAGVNMHPSPNMRIMDYMNYENAEFLKLNAYILNKAGGNWANPPSAERIDALVHDAETVQRAKSTIQPFIGGIWGVKDPRFCLTAPVVAPHMPELSLVLVRRPTWQCADSVLRRGPSRHNKSGWTLVAQKYFHRAEQFMCDFMGPKHVISYESLVNPELKVATLKTLVDFIGVDGADAELGRLSSIIGGKRR